MTRWVAEDKLESRNAAVLSGGPVGNHLIQGIGDGFVPEVLNRSIIDEIITVTEVEAFAAAPRLACEEGIAAGSVDGRRPPHSAGGCAVTRSTQLVVAGLASLMMSACVHTPTGVQTPGASPELAEQGLASWYGAELAGHVTANGEKFDPEAMTAAHKTLPFGTCVRVELVSSGRFVEVRINDRGPFVSGRIIDLSEGAARALGTLSQAPAPVRLRPCMGTS